MAGYSYHQPFRGYTIYAKKISTMMLRRTPTLPQPLCDWPSTSLEMR